MRVVTQVLTVPWWQTRPTAPVLEQHGTTIEVDLGRPDHPDKLIELIPVCHWQLRAARIVVLAEYQSVALRERTEPICTLKFGVDQIMRHGSGRKQNLQPVTWLGSMKVSVLVIPSAFLTSCCYFLSSRLC